MTSESNALHLAQSAFEAVCKARDEAREQLQAMCEAIKEAWIEINHASSGFAGLALRVCPSDSSVDLVLSRQAAALAKLQPFIKP